MKKYVLSVLFLLSFIGYSQTSSYNSGLERNKLVFGKWYINEDTETFVTMQNPVGYKQAYDELKNLLSHYELNIMEPVVDNSLLSSTVDSLDDFQDMSNSIKVKWSTITMAWRTDDVYQITWVCNDEMNIVLIKKLE
jgi:hypothetical protein